MATTIDSKGNDYLLAFSSPETGWIRDLAQTMGITKEAVVGAAMNKGLVYYMEVFIPKQEVSPVVVIPTAGDRERNYKKAGQPPKKEIDDDACDDVC